MPFPRGRRPREGGDVLQGRSRQVGEVEDLIIDNGKMIKGVVEDVGAFGDQLAAVGTQVVLAF